MIIKVCGMRDPENIRSLEALDVDITGLIFYPPSPRCVPDDGRLDDTVFLRCGKKRAGVFVNEKPGILIGKAERYHLDYIQLHGGESPETCETLRRQGYAVIKAFPVATKEDFKCTDDYPCCADFFLFDTKNVNYGGSGERFDWSLLDEYKGNTPFLLSGGLTPDCADEISSLRHPMFAGIDLNSGFETSPAIKDIAKLKDFINTIRSL
ncbi:MAG: phosphoribosylanthranilate isomerase [Tannerella sp.]|nr:phosphoribosylanthranilate isomerase [Tannerella sp.]